MRLSGSWSEFVRQSAGSDADCYLYSVKILLVNFSGVNFGQEFCLVDFIKAVGLLFVQSFSRMTPGTGDRDHDFSCTSLFRITVAGLTRFTHRMAGNFCVRSCYVSCLLSYYLECKVLLAEVLLNNPSILDVQSRVSEMAP